jgi:hypothetical protein
VRLPSPRFLLGLALVLVVCIVAAVVYNNYAKPGKGGSGPDPKPAAITCVGGSEKSELMADTDVKRILHDKYGLTVTFSPMGSYDQVQLSTDDLKARKIDCLWPSSASAQNVFESQHKGAFADYRAQTVLQSPEVVYAGPSGTDALVAAGIVQKRDNRYFIVDMKKLLLQYILAHKKWDTDLKAKDLSGPITISSTDPARSNSGFTLTQLELNIVATEDVHQAPNRDQAGKALPTIRALYDAQGLQAASSDAGFQQWLAQGAEFHAPLYAGYENQLIQQVVQLGGQSGQVLTSVRVLYPDPTIYSDHPILALDAAASRFIDAMKDDLDIQKLAWKKYGFRSSVQLGINNVADLPNPNLPLADKIITTTPPNAEVTLALLACVKDAKECH